MSYIFNFFLLYLFLKRTYKKCKKIKSKYLDLFTSNEIIITNDLERKIEEKLNQFSLLYSSKKELVNLTQSIMFYFQFTIGKIVDRIELP